MLWLIQLFDREINLVREELEQVVNEASRSVMYESLVPEKTDDSNYREFFLSPRWVNFKTAFDAITDSEANRYLNSSFASLAFKDSVVVNIHFQVFSGASVNLKPVPGHLSPPVRPVNNLTDQRSINKMDSTVQLLLRKARLNISFYYKAVRYHNNDEVISCSTTTPAANPAYQSHKYSYDLRSKNKYQLVVPSLHIVVLWRMRYYIISAAIMIVLIGLACFYILRSLANKQLYAEAKAAFTSNMSHELKTPLAIIEVALDSITRYNLQAKPEKLANYIDISKNELQRLKLIIDKALGMEDIDKGNIKLNAELYDVQQCLKLVSASMNIQGINKDAVIICEPSSEPCFVSGDPVHLTNVFYNLIENALKYGHPGVYVDVVCNCNSEFAKISIKDNGPGISSIYHDKIFERFFRVPGEEQIHQVKGSGLGLNYVKQIVEMHGGSVTVQSEPGKGSNFIVNLPLLNQQ